MTKRIALDSVCAKKIPTLSSQYEGLIDYVDISSVDNAEKRILSTQCVSAKEAPSRAKQLLEVGDILVSTVRPNLNAVAMVEKPTNNLLVGSTGYCVLRCSDNIDKRYVFHFCQSPYFVDDMTSQATGASYPAVSSGIVKSSTIPRHPIEKQRQIADRLDKISELISLRKQQLAKLDELVKSRFIELFGDPVTNEKSWSRLTLGDICEIGSSKRVFEKDYVPQGIPFFRTKEIVELSKGNSISTELFITEEHFAELKNSYGAPKKDDLLISAVGTIGTIWIVSGDFEFYFKDGNLIQIKASSNFNSVFMKYLLDELIANYKKEMSTGTAYSALTIAGLKKMLVYDVPLSLQEQFAAFVKQTDRSKFAIQQSLEKLETLKKALMQEYFG